MSFEVQVTGYGVEHPDYFIGHGLIGTDYQYANYGIGDTFNQALDDAIEMLSAHPDITGCDLAAIEALAMEHLMDDATNEKWRVEGIDGDCYWYVGLRVKRT